MYARCNKYCTYNGLLSLGNRIRLRVTRFPHCLSSNWSRVIAQTCACTILCLQHSTAQHPAACAGGSYSRMGSGAPARRWGIESGMELRNGIAESSSLTAMSNT